MTPPPRSGIFIGVSDVTERMQEVANSVQTILPAGTGFAVFAFDFGPGGRMDYVSNANGNDLLEALKEFISKHEQGTKLYQHEPTRTPIVNVENLATELQQIIGESGYSVDRRDLIKLLQQELP